MTPDDFRVDKTAFSVVPLSQADDDLAYWLTKTPHERLRAVERLRQTLYGYTDPAQRLQRVLEVVQRELPLASGGSSAADPIGHSPASPDRMVSSPGSEVPPMQTIKYVHWQEDDVWLGYLQDYPDYWTQGETLDDLVEHLKDLYVDLAGGQIPGVRKVGELVVP